MLSIVRLNRIPLLFILITVLFLTAVGCGSAAKETPPAASQQAATESAPPKSEAARTIKHAMGEETIQGTPKRVVILTNEGTEALLTVGVKPVGAVQSWVGDRGTIISKRKCRALRCWGKKRSLTSS